MKRNKLGDGKCVLYDRDCIGCGECEFCDLDPLKICDNCGKCLQTDDYAAIKIDGIFESVSRPQGGFDDRCHGLNGEHDCDCDDDCCGDDCHDCGHEHMHERKR